MKFIPEPLVSKYQQCQQCQQCSQFSNFQPLFGFKYKFSHRFEYKLPLFQQKHAVIPTETQPPRTIGGASYRFDVFISGKYKWWHNILLTCHKIQNLVFMHLDGAFSVSMSPSRCTLYTSPCIHPLVKKQRRVTVTKRIVSPPRTSRGGPSINH